jgi:hypothetical protein
MGIKIKELAFDVVQLDYILGNKMGAFEENGFSC